MSGSGPGDAPSGALAAVVRIATVGILVANVLALALGITPNLSTRMVELGESIWPGYGTELRLDPVAPDCDVAELQRRAETCVAAPPPAPGGAVVDPFAPPPAPAAPVDPFAPPPAPAAPVDPFAPPPAPAAPVDPFAPPPAPAAPVDPFAPPKPADPFAPAPAADPFAAAPQPAGPSCEALRNLHEECAKRHAVYDAVSARITPGVKQFRGAELFLSDVARFAYWKHTLVLVVLLAAASATSARMHISLRGPASRAEHTASQLAQIVAHGLWMVSCFADWQVQSRSTAESDDPALPVMWGVGFAVLIAINVRHLVFAPAFEKTGTTPARVLMTIPLYTYLAVIAGLYFQLVEGHHSGQAIYLHKYTAYPNIYLGIALYVWAGMLLSETRVTSLTFDVLSPWKLSPQILGWIVAVISAVPTAYSGASGIFVISTGKTIFQRLREGGASPRVALGATAMAGSLGVVLRPCLIVVLISVLNKNAPSDQLFHYGFLVFCLTAALYFVAMLLLREPSEVTVVPGDAAAQSGRALGRLAPFVALAVGTVLFYRFVFEIHLNEQTAQYLLPVVLLAFVGWDVLARRGGAHPEGPIAPLARATHETSHHAGALLMVMAGSVGFGGIVERSEIMSLVPTDLGSPWTAMALLVVVMVLLGMVVDGLGAVILVSVTVAPLAYANGIDPIHFWMMALVAFELGYLHPPVGLNILLARQVVGPDAHVENFPVEGFFRTWEHMIVPCTVMATALFLVAFVPFLFYGA